MREVPVTVGVIEVIQVTPILGGGFSAVFANKNLEFTGVFTAVGTTEKDALRKLAARLQEDDTPNATTWAATVREAANDLDACWLGEPGTRGREIVRTIRAQNGTIQPPSGLSQVWKAADYIRSLLPFRV